MSKLSELEGSQIFIFETNYYTQKVSNKTCNQTKESRSLSFTLTFPLALFFTPLLYTSLLFFSPLLFFVVHLLAHIISRSSFCSPPLQDAVGPFPFSHSLFHLHYFGCSSFSLILHATFLCFHLLLALSRLSSDPVACCIADFHQSSAPCISSPF